MADAADRPDRDGVRRGEAENRADRAEDARRGGAPVFAAQEEDEALRTDPEGLANALEAASRDHPTATAEAADTDDGDEAVHAITGTVEPGRGAPSRAGITGSGSGADGM